MNRKEELYLIYYSFYKLTTNKQKLLFIKDLIRYNTTKPKSTLRQWINTIKLYK
jgi:hypothetical protein